MLLNKNLVAKVLSAVLAVVGASMLLPALISAIYAERTSFLAFLGCALPALLAGILLLRRIPNPDGSYIRMRDGFFIVAVSWAGMSLLGSLPFLLSGAIPRFADAFFETASGFSTTGATVLSDIEALPKGMLFWRSLTHWLGGMGVLMLTVALLPKLGIGGQKIMRAETTGPTMDILKFTANETARTLYRIYLIFTVLLFALLLLCGLSPYDAAVHTFGTVGTGGYSNYASSVAAFQNPAAEVIIGVFMLLCGVNFGLYTNIPKRTPKKIFRDPELRVYLGIVAASTIFIAMNLKLAGAFRTVFEAARAAFFQVSSIITTTGYATADFDLWPLPSKFVLFTLMMIGGCAGSTAGGVKVIRIILAGKLIERGAFRRLHPNAVSPITVGGSTVSALTMSQVAGFLILYALTTVFATLLLCLDGASLVTAFSSAVSCLGNVGPGFEAAGPALNFGFYSAPAKLLLSVLMIAGRLELYTVFLLFTPMFWNRNK